MYTQNKKNQLSLYWKCQISGWSLVSIYWAYVVFTRDHYGYFLTFLKLLEKKGLVAVF
jgi:hypothetical protein